VTAFGCALADRGLHFALTGNDPDERPVKGNRESRVHLDGINPSASWRTASATSAVVTAQSAVPWQDGLVRTRAVAVFQFDFLVAAHVKERAECSDSMRRDVPTIVMAARHWSSRTRTWRPTCSRSACLRGARPSQID
jgi:hypothetical protein